MINQVPAELECSYIGGQWISNASDHILVYNPATLAPIGRIPNLGKAETIEAVTSAQNAFIEWSRLPAESRSDLLWSLHAKIQQCRDWLASIITLENGKPYREAVAEVKYAASYVRWFAEQARRIDGTIIGSGAHSNRMLVVKKPVGVVALISPWNFPLAMIVRKLSAALAAGCSAVIKPSELTPFSTIALARLISEVGFPTGSVNVVCGSPQAIGEVFCQDSRVRKLSFTGSTRVGKLLLGQAAADVKRCSMELGGNAPFIVFEDADLDSVVEGMLIAKFRNSGQTCIAANRILVHSAVFEQVIDKICTKVHQLNTGDGFDDCTDIGPLITPTAAQNINQKVDEAITAGAQFIGGKRARGQFFKPLVISGIPTRTSLWTDEVFGPVLSINSFNSEKQAIAEANHTPHGLAAYLYTRCPKRLAQLPCKLQFGMVGVNTGKLSHVAAPFGGIKHSGFGREGSKHGLEDYLNTQYICEHY